MIATTDIDRMSLSERLEALDLLWQSLSAVPQKVESPPWHEEVLADRLSRAEARQARFLSLAETKSRPDRG
jgi:hypothetical protein